MGAMPPEGNTTTWRSPGMFYKFIEQSVIHQKQLDIPRRFIEIYGDDLSDIIYLAASTPDTWPVCLRKDNQRVWLRGGWQKFVEDQFICAGCFLVFKYKGNSKFHVDIHNLAAPEIKSPCIAPLTLEEFAGEKRFPLSHKKEDLDDTICIVNYQTCCATPGFSLKNDYDDIHRTSWSSLNDPTQSTRTSSFHEEHTPVMVQRMVMAARDIGIQVGENELIENNVKETSKEIDPSCQAAKPLCGKRKAKAKPEADRDEYQAEDFSIGEPCAKVSSRSSPSRHRAEIAVVAATSCFKSDHPFVSIVMKPSYVNYLYLPSSFARMQLQGLAGNINLQHDGDLWPVKLVLDSHYNGFIRKGWSAFSRDNDLVEGDVCVFELVNKNDAVLKVSIFRHTNYLA